MAEQHGPSAELRARLSLDKHQFRNAHALGQNFILNEAVIRRLLDGCCIDAADNVLEIGPGAGVMTRMLAERCRSVLAVEIDQNLRPVLDEVLDGAGNVQVVYRDFMKTDVAALTREHFGGEPYRVVANLPYYITADILLRLANCARQPESICIMVQREAAERLMSAPGEKQWCALAAQLQYYGSITVLDEIPPEAFSPPPHVSSCFIRIERHRSDVVSPADKGVFLRLINAAFAMRRKTLANNLKAAFGLDQMSAASVIEDSGLDSRVRGEALTLEELCRVADELAERLPK